MQFENQKSAVSVCGTEWKPRSSENRQHRCCVVFILLIVFVSTEVVFIPLIVLFRLLQQAV